MPAWKPVARPLLLVRRTRWSTPCSRATATVSSVEPSSITSHSTSSKPSTARGRSARVRGSCSASLKQGIWMMSFIAVDLPRLAYREYPRARSRFPSFAGVGAELRANSARLSPPVRIQPRLDGKRDTHPAPAGPDLAGAAARSAAELGGGRTGGALRGRDRRLLRVPDLPHLRLVLRAALGAGPASPAPPGLPGLPRPDRASA